MDQKQKGIRSKDKSKHTGDMDSYKFSITGKGKSREAKQASSSQPQDKDNIYSVVTHMERTLFIVDLSKLEAEGDTLEEACVFYRPQHEFKKSQYEQRCSQVIGLSLCTKNLTGKFPKFLLMKGTGFAIRSLGRTYIMGLSSRLDEPGACAVEYLDRVYNFFRFYYHSPDMVMQSSQGDWEIFTTAMSSIFKNIMDFVVRDQHSVPAMFNPLPYIDSVKKDHDKRIMYMLSSRILRACQKHPSVIGGCIMHNSQLVVSQFPPSLTELLILVGAGGVELDKRSILEDNIAPDKVWILEVYLTREEVELARDHRKNLLAFQATYASMIANPQLSTSTLHWRFQSSISSKALADSLRIRNRKNWRRRNKQPNGSVHSHRVKNLEPVASSTPQRKTKSDSIASDEVTISPHLSTVSYKSNRKSQALANSPGSNPGNETDELYVDAVDVDPTMAIGPKMLHLFSNSSSNAEEKVVGTDMQHEALNIKPIDVGSMPQLIVKEVKSQVQGTTGSTSSEGFATPSPTSPHMSKISPSQLPQVDSSFTPSFKTACESSLSADEAGKGGGGGVGTGTLTQKSNTEQDPQLEGSGSTSEPTQTTPINLQTKEVSSDHPNLSGIRKTHFSESDDDFVDSEDLEELLKHIALGNSTNQIDSSPGVRHPLIPSQNKTSSLVQTSALPTTGVPLTSSGNQNEESPPPPVPPRMPSPEDGSMVTGILDNPKGYPYLPQDDTPFNNQGTKELLNRVTCSEENGLNRTSWVYNTMGKGNGELKDTRDVRKSFLSPTRISEAATMSEGVVGGGVINGMMLYGDKKPEPPFPRRHDYEEIDDKVIKEIKQTNKSPIITTKKELVNDYEEIDKDTLIRGRPGQGKSSHPLLQNLSERSHPDGGVSNYGVNRYDDRDYEEIDDMEMDEEQRTSKHNSNGSGKDNALPFLEDDEDVHNTEDNESKTSSMTVTLDLSHIAKDYVMYSSRDMKVSSSVDIAQIPIDIDNESSEEAGGDGTVTPVEMTYNESMLSLVKAKLEQKGKKLQEDGEKNGEDLSSKLNDSVEYSSIHDEDGDSGSVFMSNSEIEESLPEQPVTEKLKTRTTWLTHTIDRQNTSKERALEKYCVYVQQYMNTIIILLADSGLQNHHSVLNELWRSMVEELLDLETTLDGNKVEPTPPKTTACIVSYSGQERMCEAQPLSAAYHFRHAIRRAHQEYLLDPSLRQISLSKEHCRVLSQRVHEREIYVQPGKLVGDALTLHGALERHVKVKSSLRQQPINGPKIMFI